MSKKQEKKEIRHGNTVYDADGDVLGVVRGFDQHGFYVTANDDVAVLPERPSHSDRTDAVMWRCWECGEMGRIDDLPDSCPSCDAPREDIYYWQED